MLFLRWLCCSVFHLIMLVPAAILAPVFSLFTRNGWPEWGSWFWTWDNPPEGDLGYITKRAPFPGELDGIKGYINRVCWLWRNPLYGLNRLFGIKLIAGERRILGDRDITDRYGVPGIRLALFSSGKRILAFEFYAVVPYVRFPSRCLRIRLGWKIGGDSFYEDGFAPLVCVINPFKQYNESGVKL